MLALAAAGAGPAAQARTASTASTAAMGASGGNTARAPKSASTATGTNSAPAATGTNSAPAAMGTNSAPVATVAPAATVATAAPTATTAPLGLAPAPVPSDERVAIRLPPDVAFEVSDLAAGTFAALQPFALSFHGARLAPGRTLRISVRVDTQLAPGIAVSFRCRNPQGGNCSSGSLSAATFTEVFTGTGGITAGGCELAWTLACGAKVRRAGRYAVTMRWQIESVISDRDAALAAARSGLPLLAPFGSALGRLPAVGAPKTGGPAGPAGGGAALPPVKPPS